MNHSVAILLMAGEGKRFLSATPKQYHRLAGKKIYQYTLETFLQVSSFKEIILVVDPHWHAKVSEEVASYGDARVRLVKGGSTRQESSFLALQACSLNTSYVVIHDAVRPFVSERILREHLEKVIAFGAVNTCIPSDDTIVQVKGKDQIETIPLRSEYWRGQTPQSFAYSLIVEAHKAAAGGDSTDDCRLVLERGHPVHRVLGDVANIKITTHLDLVLAEQMLRTHVSAKQGEESDLAGKKYAVVGGNGGIGSAVCELLEGKGAIVHSLSRTSLEYPMDLCSFSSVKEVFERLGEIDGLINSAGLFYLKAVEALSELEIQALVHTNLLGVIYACQCAKIKPQGHILNVASSSYLRGRKGYAVYSACKAAVVNFSQGLALERPDLYVHAVAPQRADTSMRRTHFQGDLPEELLSTEEIAQEIVALLARRGDSGGVQMVRKGFSLIN